MSYDYDYSEGPACKAQAEHDANLVEPLDGLAGGYGEDSFIAVCEICLDPIDYCLGHGTY
jgi:hypothetical protein